MEVTMSKRVVVHQVNDHADWKHGSAAKHARQAVRDGVEHTFEEKDGSIHLLAQDRYDGGYYDLVARRNGDRLEEVTAFQPKQGVLSAILSWLGLKGAKRTSVDQYTKYV
jgi:hypothetical protein